MLLVSALAVALACAAAMVVVALPSGHVIHNFPAGWYALDSMVGYSQIAESYTTGYEDMGKSSPSSFSDEWQPEEGIDVAIAPLNSGGGGGARKLRNKMGKTLAAASASGSSAWTISAWVYIHSSSEDFGLFTFGPKNLCDGEDGVGFFTWTGPMLLSMSSCNLDGTQGTTAVVEGWHHVAVTYSAANSPVTTAYLDGVVEFTSAAVLLFNPEIAFIAARTADTSGSILQNSKGNFYLDDLRIWSRALTVGEVQFDKHGGAALLGLIGNYDGSVTSAGKLRDRAQGNHATHTGVAATYTTTATCPVATYVSSCGALACRYVLEDSSIPMCGPCLAGYHSAVLANLSANCALDIPNAPTSPSAAAAGSKCLTVSASPPLVSAAVTSYTVKYGRRSVVASVATASATMSTTICGLTNGKSYTFSIRATNAAGTGAAVTVSGTPVSSGCDVGYYLTSGSSTCTACAAGTYSDTTSATSCTSCIAGKYSSRAARSTCADCAIGHFGDSTAQTYCHSCARGRYGAAAAVTVCERCIAGTYSSVIAQSVCSQCSVGTYQPNIGRSVCFTCAKSSATSAGSATCV